MCDLLDKMAVSSFGIHWWHKGFEVEDSQQNKMTSESLLAQVFQNECPAVVKAFGWKNLHFAQ